MRIKPILLAGILSCAMGGGAAYAQTVGDEIVLPAGMFAKDFNGVVYESGGIAGTGIQHGAFRFPKKADALVGITTLWPPSWVGHDVDIVFDGSTGGMYFGQFRIQGNLENTVIGRTAVLAPEDNGGTEVLLVHNYTVPQWRRFGIAIGRDVDHPGDTDLGIMNFEYLVLRLTN